MTNEIAPAGRWPLTFLSCFLALTLLAGLGSGGCSATDGDKGGPGGSAGGAGGSVGGAGGSVASSRGGAGGATAGAGGAIGGSGGATCGATGGVGLGGPCVPPSNSRFDCAGTYDEQAPVSDCSGLGNITTARGSCGDGWAWTCQTGLSSYYCIYDANKSLVKALSCGESRCDVSADVSMDGGRACDITELHPTPNG